MVKTNRKAPHLFALLKRNVLFVAEQTVNLAKMRQTTSSPLRQ